MSGHQAMLAVVAAMAFAAGTGAVDAESVQGFERSAARPDEVLLEGLRERIHGEHFKQINGIVVIRDGRLLVEEYFNGSDRDSTHDVRSVGKTFASAVLGIAIGQGHIAGVDSRLGEYYDLEAYANYSERKAAVTLQQLLTMTSGFDGFDFEPASRGNEENMYPQPDWVRWTLDLPMATDRGPGERWAYFTAGVVVIGDILNSAVPGGLEAYADRYLFEPIGVRNYQWQHTPQRVANTAGGIQLTPLGFAAFGQLYKNGGSWQGSRVLPASWVAESLKPRIDAVNGERYGYLWWHKVYDVDGRKFPVSYAGGNGGNKIFVFDEQPLVVVITASAYGRPYMHRQVDELMQQWLLPAVLPDGIRR